MFVAIVYESLFGNTREIAEAIAEGIAEADPRADVACCGAAEAGPELPRADLLIVGAPTHFLGLPSERSRIMRPRYRPESGSWDLTGPLPRAAANVTGRRHPAGEAADEEPRPAAPAGVREWLGRLAPAPPGAKAAAFDTRLDTLTAGSAAREIGRSLHKLGYRLVTRPEGFTVADFEGPLTGGERMRARRWGAEVSRAAGPADARQPCH